MANTPGALIREARIRHGVTQRRLATRAGTTQSAISRIETDSVSPSAATLDRLLRLLGESLTLDAVPYESGVDRSLLRMNLEFSPEARVRRGLGFADFVRRQHATRAERE